MKAPTALLVLASLAAPTAAQAAPQSCRKASRDVAVAFGETMELKDLVTWATGFTCKDFQIEPRLVPMDPMIHIIAPEKLSPAKAYKLFNQALAMMHLTIVPKGNVYRIVVADRAVYARPAVYIRRLPSQIPTLEFEVVKR